MAPRIQVYVDGFSFYYGITRRVGAKWCDLYKLSQTLLGVEDITKVKIFAGRSESLPNNPQAPKRQNIYFRALRTNPRIDVIECKFSSFKKWLPEITTKEMVRVRSFQEKHADVEMALSIALDAREDFFDTALVVTNDIDFVAPIRYARYVCKKI